MKDDVKWITKNGKHIPITNEYMNNKIRNKMDSNKKLSEKEQQIINERYKLEEKIEKITNKYYSGESDYYDEKEFKEELTSLQEKINKLVSKENKIKKILQEQSKKQIQEMGGLL